MSPIEAKFLRWIRRVKRGGAGRLVLGHVEAAGRGAQLGEWPVRNEDGESALEELAADVMQVAGDDTDGQSAHTPQQYLALYYTQDAPQESYSRFKFRLSVPQSDFSGSPSVSSEPPTESGLVSQAMRFSEMAQRTSWGGMSAVVQAMQHQLQRADDRDARQEERHERRDQRYFTLMDKLEGLKTEEHLRDTATMAAHSEMEDRRAFYNRVTLLGSSALTKLGGPKLLPTPAVGAPAPASAAPEQAEAATPAMDPALLQHIQMLMASIEPKQMQAIQGVLTMEQAIALGVLYNAVTTAPDPLADPESGPELAAEPSPDPQSPPAG